jgi:hypothetical protein
MRALTIWQPYATLSINGWKRFEFRDYKMPAHIIGQRIAVHAAVRKPRNADIAEILNNTHWVCAGAETRDVGAAYTWADKVWRRSDLIPLGAVLGTAIIGKPFKTEMLDSPFAHRWNWAWPMLDIERFDAPVPAKGAQGFWNWEQPQKAIA